MEKIDYTGTVYLLDHKYPEPLLNHSIKKLEEKYKKTERGRKNQNKLNLKSIYSKPERILAKNRSPDNLRKEKRADDTTVFTS